MSSCLAVLPLVALFSGCAFGQGSASATLVPDGFSGTVQFNAAPVRIKAVTGAPYSAEEVSETSQTLADGTHIARTRAPTRVYRDSLGRTRIERPVDRNLVGSGPQAPHSPTFVEISDPVAQVRYLLDTEKKVAHRQKIPAPGGSPGAAGTIGSEGGSATSAARVAAGGGGEGANATAQPALTAPPAKGVEPETDVPRPHLSIEKLGGQTIEGVPVEGTRRTITFPVGAAGNDRPITSTSETWTSPELQVIVLAKRSDPRLGEITRRLTDISRSEPDPSLFQVPPDYKVVDEKGDFTVEWGSPRQ